MSKFVGKFRERDYEDEYVLSDKKRKKSKPVKHTYYEFARLRHDEENYYEKPSRSKSRRAY